MNEHLNPKSYSWCLMRYAIVRYVSHSLKTFLPKVGMELSGMQYSLVRLAEAFLIAKLIVRYSCCRYEL